MKGKEKKENLSSFRYVPKNIRKVELVNRWVFMYEHSDYRVELYSGSVVIVRVEDLPCFNGGLLASILDTDREPIVEWNEFPPFFRGASRRLAQQLRSRY